jgi:type IV pilus assembly protein PilA
MKRLFGEGQESQKGFTLVELLVVIIVIAVLCAIAIPTYMGQRERANDTAAYTLVRNGLTILQTAFVDTGDYTAIDVAMLNGLDSSMVWVDNGGDLVGTAPAGITAAVVADAADRRIAVNFESQHVVDIASRSASGNWFGAQIDTMDLSHTGYVKVKVVDGSADMGW